MNTTTTWEMFSSKAIDTEQIAERLGKNLRGGEVIELVSDLGGGKTTFTRGLVRGAGSHDSVASPTFTLSREYRTPNFTIAHFDFYRLGEAGIVGEELAEVIHEPEYVTIVEWGDIVHDVLPTNRLTITIRLVSEDERQLIFSCPIDLDYVMIGLK